MSENSRGDSEQAAARVTGNAARWAVGQNIAKQVIDLAVFLILAKLLDPISFGVVAMSSSFIVLLNVIAELGIGDSLVQRADLSAKDMDTAFWCALAMAVVCASCVWLAAPSIAKLYGQANVADILRALTPLFVFQALTIVPQAAMQRAYNFRSLALRALVGNIIGGAVGLSLAHHGAGPWSLVAQQLTNGAVGLLGLYVLSSWRPRMQWSRNSAEQILRFGLSVLTARVLNVAASKLDDLVVGLALGPAALGLYSIACRMLLALEQLFCQGVDSLALAWFSRASDNRGQMARLFLQASHISALLAAPAFIFASVMAPELILTLLGERWKDSAPILQILLLAGFTHSLMHFNHAVFKAFGRPALSIKIALYSTCLNFFTLMVAVQFDIVAVAISYLARGLLIAPIGLVIAFRLMGLTSAAYFRVLVQPVLAVVAAVLAMEAVKLWILPPGGGLLAVILCCLVGSVVYLLWLFAFQFRTQGEASVKWPFLKAD
jgi:O-antigen/teichoic acid export membrane protein